MACEYPSNMWIRFAGVGFNNGRDTLEYLRSGARVVAVEANPSLAKRGERMFAPFLGAGQLVLLNVLIVDAERAEAGRQGTLPFYVHLSRDEWSSLQPELGCRAGSRGGIDRRTCEERRVPLLTCRALIASYGIPTYLKYPHCASHREG